VNTPPPAAVTVLEGERTERETNLEAELATEREARRKAETDAAYAQDEARRLKAVGLTPTPAPKKQKSMWNDFFGEED
jgi:membrane protein involved in colicin uptake